MKYLITAFILIVIAITPALAQDIDPGWTYPVLDYGVIVATIVNAVGGIVLAAFGAAPVTAVIVSLLKRIPQLRDISSPTLVLSTASVLYVGAIIASVTGYEVQFSGFLDVVAVSAPVLISFLTTLIGAPKVYEAARANDVAVLGTSRDELWLKTFKVSR